MDTRFIANLIRISLKLETEKDFSLSDKVDNLLKTAQYAGQFDRSNPYTDGMFGVQVSGSSPTAFGPYQGPGNDVPFVSELDPMTIMKLQHTKGTKPGQSAFLDALERVMASCMFATRLMIIIGPKVSSRTAADDSGTSTKITG